MKKVVIAGGGVMGNQIALQFYYHGFHTVILEVNEEAVEKTRERLAFYQTHYQDELMEMKVDEVAESILIETDMATAFEDADVVIESIIEDPAAKKAFFQAARDLLPEKTLLLTNSSTLLPSMFADDTGRPERFLSMHFTILPWEKRLIEVMGHDRTSPEAINEVVELTKAIGMNPVRVKKEQPGYIFNSMQVPFLYASLMLYVDDIADPEDVDMAWRQVTGSPNGPFQMMDRTGLETIYTIAGLMPGAATDPTSGPARARTKLKNEYLDKGKTGVVSGEGFYKYDD